MILQGNLSTAQIVLLAIVGPDSAVREFQRETFSDGQFHRTPDTLFRTRYTRYFFVTGPGVYIFVLDNPWYTEYIRHLAIDRVPVPSCDIG